MILKAGSKISSKAGFTLIELLVVVALIALSFGIATVGISFGKTKLTSTTYQLTQDIQGLYSETIKTGKIHRIVFDRENNKYTIEVFELPQPRPKETDYEALEKWEDKQRELEEKRAQKEWSQRTRLDFGDFKELKSREVSSPITFKTLLIPRLDDSAELSKPMIIFYPTGEIDQALIVLADDSSRANSLIVEPMSGRVHVRKGEVLRDDFLKEFGGKK